MGSGLHAKYSMEEILQLFYQEPQVVMWNCSDHEIENMKSRQRKKSVSRLDKDEEEVKRNENEPSIKMEEDIFLDDVVNSFDTWQEQRSSSVSENSDINLDVERSSEEKKMKHEGEHFLKSDACSSSYNLAQTALVKKENYPPIQSNYTKKMLKTTEEQAGVCRNVMSNIPNLKIDQLRMPGSEVVPHQNVHATKLSQSAQQMCGIIKMYFNCTREAQEREKNDVYVEVYVGNEPENKELFLPGKTPSNTEASDGNKDKVSENVPQTNADICLNEATSKVMSLKLKSCSSTTPSRKLIIEMSKIVIDVVIKLQIFYQGVLEKEPHKLRCSLQRAQNYIKFAKPVALIIHKILMTRFTYQDLLDLVFQNISCLISQTHTKYIITKSTIVDILYVVLESDPGFVDRVRHNLYKPISFLYEHDHRSNKNTNNKSIDIRFNQTSQKPIPYVVTNVKIVSDEQIFYEETQKKTHSPEKQNIINGANQDRECQYIASIVAQPATCSFAPRVFPVQTPLSSLRFLYKNKCFAQNGKRIQNAPGVIVKSPIVKLTQNQSIFLKPDELRVLGKVDQNQRDLNHATNPVARNILQFKNASQCPVICPSMDVNFPESNSITRSINDMPTTELTRNLEEPPKIVAIFAARQMNAQEANVCNASSKHTLKKAKLLIDNGRVFWKDTLTYQMDAQFKAVSGNSDDRNGLVSSKEILGTPDVVADSKGRLVYADHRKTIVENTHHLPTLQKNCDSPLQETVQRTENRPDHLEVTRIVPTPLKPNHSPYQRSGSYLHNAVYERNVEGHWSMVKNKPSLRVSAASALDVAAKNGAIGKGPRDCTKDTYVQKRVDVSSISLDSLRCTRCSKAATVTCAGCRARFYCSENCQRRDWVFYHGARCGKL